MVEGAAVAITTTSFWWVEWAGRLAPLSSWCFYVAPAATTMVQIRRDQSVGNLPLLPYTTMIVSNFLWVVYGMLRHEPKIILSNGVGLILGCVYFVQYLRFMSPNSNNKSSSTTTTATTSLPGTAMQHIQAIGMIAVTVLLVSSPFGTAILLPGPHADPADWLGSAGVLFSVLMFASPLVALKTVVRTQSARGAISLSFTLASIANNTLWGVFGYYGMHDIHVTIQGALGLAFGMIQLAIKLYYGDGPGVVARGGVRRHDSGVDLADTISRGVVEILPSQQQHQQQQRRSKV